MNDKIEDLRKLGLHDICFRNAGVGLMFFEPPEDFVYPEFKPGMTPEERNERDRSWRQYLSVKDYYPTFEEAVEAEWKARCASQAEPAPQVNTSVTGKVREYHYRCLAPEQHEISILAPLDLTIDKQVMCPVNVCISTAEVKGDNPAEISKNPS